MTDIDNQVNERDPSAQVASEPPAGSPRSVWTHPDLIAGIVIILAAGALLTRTTAMPVMTSLLPVATSCPSGENATALTKLVVA